MASIWRGGAPLLLASTSPARRDLLRAAGLPVETEPPGLDERAFETSLGARMAPRDLALHLAAAKAAAVAIRRPDRVVVGADQVLDLDGVAVPKAADRSEAAARLARMAGRPHLLHAAAFLHVPGRDPVGFAEAARLTMRVLGEAAIDAYLDVAGAAATRSAGGYEIEAVGIHLFEATEGEQATILGLPLLRLLAALRDAGLLSVLMSGPRAFVIGHPVAHSRSPLIHGQWLVEFGLAGSYERIDVAPADLRAFLAGFGAQGFVGGNVTIPHKEAAFGLLACATSRAERLGAANTLWLEDGRLCGDNTDGEGFVASVEEAVGPGALAAISHAVVVGAGGAARAIAPALVDGGVARVTICNRNRARANEVARLAPGMRAVDWGELYGALSETDLLVNTTQLGMDGEPALDLDLSTVRDHAIVADIVYVPLETPLLAAARGRGLRTVDGLGMLLHQAAPGFARWFGRMPAVTPALRARVEADLAGR